MGMEFAHNTQSTPCTFKEFTDAHECTWGAVRSYVQNHFEFAPSTSAVIPADVLEALTKKYTKRGNSTIVKPAHNVAPALSTAKNQPIRQEKPQSKPNPVIEYIKSLGLSDFIIWITSLVTLYGCTELFAEMGFTVGVLYTMAILYILHISKEEKYQNTSKGATYFMYAMELAAVFVHTSMFNIRIWDNAQNMVFNPQPGSEVPFWCAFVLGLFICAFSIFAVEVRLSQTREVSNAKFYGS